MTPEQKLKHAILLKAAELRGYPPPLVTVFDVDDLYRELALNCGDQDAREEVRSSHEETGLACSLWHNYESKAVAARMPDGTWVGWTYYYGGGKHSSPEALDWMGEAYDVECREEERTVVIKTFSKAG